MKIKKFVSRGWSIIFILNLLCRPSVLCQDNRVVANNVAVGGAIGAADSSLQKLNDLYHFFYNKGLYDSSLKYAQQFLNIGKKLNSRKAIATGWYCLGLVYTNLTLYDSARFYLRQTAIEAQQTKDSVLLAKSYIAYSMLYRYQSDYPTAFAYAMKSAEIAEKSPNPDLRNLLAKIYTNLGTALIGENQLEKGIAYEKKALGFKNYPDEKRYRILLYLDIADTYLKMSKPLLAKPYLDSALALNKNFDNNIFKMLASVSEANYFEAVGDFEQSLKASLISYKYTGTNNYLKAEASENIARIYFKQKKYTQAFEYANIGNELSLQLKHFKVAAGTFNLMKDISVVNGDYKAALKYAELNKKYADSATNEVSQQTSLSLEARYETKKKEIEIADLRIKNAEKELQAIKRTQFILIAGTSAAGIIVLLGFLYYNSNNKKIIAQKEQGLQKVHIQFLEGQQQVISLQSMVNGQEAERTRIAKDLHDGLGGLFSTIKMYFNTLKHDEPVLQNHDLFSKSYALIDTASVEVRRIAHNMMPETLVKLGLIHAVQDLCSNVSAGKVLMVTLQSYGMEHRFSPSVEIMLYRIIQELINNIIKHAKATEAIVQFNRTEERLSVTVEDNGCGFKLHDANNKNHIGLETIKSRINYLNGNMSIDSQQGIGTTIMMEFLITKEI